METAREVLDRQRRKLMLDLMKELNQISNLNNQYGLYKHICNELDYVQTTMSAEYE